MKKFLLFPIFISVLFSAKSQNWAAPGAVWYYSTSNFTYTGYIRISKIADTLINGKTCDVLEKYRKGYNYMTSQFDSLVMGHEYTYTQNDTVFYYRFNQFFVLYDFNSAANDTWIAAGWNNSPCSNTDTVTVDSSGTVIINSTTLKALWMPAITMGNPQWQFYGGNQPNMPTIVEKMGCLGYMFPEVHCVTDSYEGGPLRCYSDSSGWSYQSGVSPTCNFILGTNELIEENLFSIFPNPSSGVFVINGEKKISEIEITDVFGRKVGNVQSTVGKGKIEINLTKEAKGIYFVKVIGEEGKYSVKKIIIE